MLKTMSTLFLLLTSQAAMAGDGLAHVKHLPEGAESPKGTLADVAWMAGHWRGEALGGIAEEVWSAALGGSMMGSFKLARGEAVQFYELQTISEEGGTLVFRLKHFHSDMKGWEEKDEVVEYPLVEVTQDTVYFSGLTLERLDDEHINIYVAMKSQGSLSELKFAYTKVSS